MREWFKDLRLKAGLTQSDIAVASRVDVSTISKIELGERRPSVEVAKAIAQVLEFDWTLFFPDEEKEVI